jgi:DNA gyrase/topoisomerase IV subunit B
MKMNKVMTAPVIGAVFIFSFVYIFFMCDEIVLQITRHESHISKGVLQMAKQFKDDKIYIKENDLDAVRRRPTMYISSLGDAGAFHLCKEIIDNNRDECLKKDSPGNEIDIQIFDDKIISQDNGRGIPTELLRVVHETNQAGSNMTRAGGMTAGENGTGTTTYTAMSSELIVTTFRPTEHKTLTLHYKEGELIDEKLEDYNGTRSGLLTMFKPSKQVLGTNKIPVDMLVEWIKQFDFTLPKDIKMTYRVRGKKYEVKHKKLEEYFDQFIPNDARMGGILKVTCDGKLDEIVLEKTYKRQFKVDVVFMYSNPEFHKGEDVRQSWMNMIHTSDNGSHMDGAIKGYMKFIQERISKKNKKFEDVDLKKDILAHLNVVVRGECNFANMFSSQAKHKVFDKSLGVAIADAVYETLSNMNTNVISQLCDVVIGNHRARIEGEKARNVASATRVKKKWSDPESYIPCASIKTDMPKELFMVEGKSAGGGLDGARDARYQAIIKFRGKSQNVYDVDINDAVNTDSWKDLIPVLECGVGPTFDIRKLKFDKIIIATDADIDGFHIRTIICTFFKKFLPEIIDAGKLYIAEPPLYQLVNGKDVSYVATQTEYIEKCIKSIGDLRISFTDTKVSNVSVQDFVRDAFDYLNTLKECSIDHSVNRYLLEHIAHGIAMYNGIDGFIKNVDKWIRSLVKIYPELGFNHDTNQVTATIDLVDQLVIIDDELCDSLMPIIDIIRRYGFLIHYTSEKRGLNKTTPISGFFEYIEDLYPVIKSRFKGLGSSDPSVMREVVMDPRTRRLIRVTANDVSTWQKMGILVGEGKENVRQRKEMLMNFKFTKADIDN